MKLLSGMPLSYRVMFLVQTEDDDYYDLVQGAYVGDVGRLGCSGDKKAERVVVLCTVQ